MRLIHRRRAEMHVVGGDERQVLGIGEIDQRALRRRALRQARGAATRHKAGCRTSLRDDRAAFRPPRAGLPATSRLSGPPGPPVSAIKPSACAASSCGLHMRPVARLRAQIGGAQQLREIAIARLVLRPAAAGCGGCSRETMPGAGAVSDRSTDNSAAHDRLHPRLGQRLADLIDAEQIAHVGDGQGRHVVAAREPGQFVGPHRAFQERIGALHPKMNEAGRFVRVGHRGADSFSRCGASIGVRPAPRERAMAVIHRSFRASASRPPSGREQNRLRHVGERKRSRHEHQKPRRRRRVFHPGHHRRPPDWRVSICSLFVLSRTKRIHCASGWNAGSQTSTIGAAIRGDGPMLTGSCLCGSVAYEVDAPAGPIVHCHCETCHGSAFSSVSPVPRDRFRWTKGEDLLASFEFLARKFRRILLAMRFASVRRTRRPPACDAQAWVPRHAHRGSPEMPHLEIGRRLLVRPEGSVAGICGKHSQEIAILRQRRRELPACGAPTFYLPSELFRNRPDTPAAVKMPSVQPRNAFIKRKNAGQESGTRRHGCDKADK